VERAHEQRDGPEEIRKKEARKIPEGKTGSEERQESRQISRLFFASPVRPDGSREAGVMLHANFA
jgi:hypothetical protein